MRRRQQELAVVSEVEPQSFKDQKAVCCSKRKLRGEKVSVQLGQKPSIKYELLTSK